MVNNTEDNVIIFKPSSFIRVFKTIFRLIFLLWVTFAIYKYNINPAFFGATGIFAAFIILFISNRHFQLHNDHFKIVNKRPISFFNSKKTYFYPEIEQVEFLRNLRENPSNKTVIKSYILRGVAISLGGFGGIFESDDDEDFILFLKNGKTKSISTKDNEPQQMENMVKILKEKIND